jgi:hypothetical protein
LSFGDLRDDGGSSSHSSETLDDEELAMEGDTAVLLDAIPYGAGRLLSEQARGGAEGGQVVIVAVIGNWRRVEALSRRVLEAPPLPHELKERLASEGSQALNAASAGIAEAWRSEVHEAVLNLTDEDQNQTLQLIVFQVGAAAAFDAKDLGVAADPALIEAVSRGDHNATDHVVHDLGSMPPPCRWCLAEFFIDGSRPLPYDEDEMAAPLTKKPVEDEGHGSRNNSAASSSEAAEYGHTSSPGQKQSSQHNPSQHGRD